MGEKRKWMRAFVSMLVMLVGVSCGGQVKGPDGGHAYRKKPAKIQKPYKVWGKWYTPIADATGFEQVGIASWYGKKFHGRKTSNGERYDMHAMTAAHKTLPFNTVVRVENLDNGRECIVRINDRGPFVDGRIIDLSNKAARAIGSDITGTARVRITAMAPRGRKVKPGTFTSGNFTVQVGAFTVKANAERLAHTLESRYGDAHVVEYDRGDALFWRVRAGRYGTIAKAERAEAEIRKTGFPHAMAVAE